MAQFEEPTPKYPWSPLVTRLEALTSELFVLRHEQIVDQTLEECKYLRNWHPRNGFSESRLRQHVARLEPCVIEMLYRRGINIYRPECQADFIKWLNSSEAAPWRTSTGGV